MRPVILCPRCGEYPARRRILYRGRTPLCEQCVAAARRAHDQKWTALRSKERALRAPAPTDNDISEQEIERRFAAAKAAIRERALARMEGR